MLRRLLERLFQLTEHRTTVRTEVIAGLTTFLTMAYIIFVQPTVLNAAGMDFGAVLVATCISSGIATLLMGLTANYPIAVAPAMGHNFFFAYTVVVGMRVPWRTALGGVAIAGTISIRTAGVGLRERLIPAIPASLKHAIAVGIGLLVALIGLEWGGLVVGSPGTLVALGSFKSPATLLTIFGLTDGIAFGVIAYAVLKIAVGRPRDTHWLIYLFAVLFLARYVWLSK
jgi:adenine/guanine/hypoxanthine permease